MHWNKTFRWTAYAIAAVSLIAAVFSARMKRDAKELVFSAQLAASKNISSAKKSGDEAARASRISEKEAAALASKGRMAFSADEVETAAPRPKSAVQVLQELAGENKKPAPVSVDENEFSRPVGIPAREDAPAPASRAPAKLGQDGMEGGPEYILAPVEYKIFRDSQTYSDFTSTHQNAKFPPADFGRQMVVMLVSASELPDRMFDIVEAKAEKKRLAVRYRFNPFAEAPAGFYAAAAVEKTTLPVELEQVP